MQKKIVSSKFIEFGYELISVLPYAYTLYKQGLLEETVSGFDTNCLYFFSPKHTEINSKRKWNNVFKLTQEKIPNIYIHEDLNFNFFNPPPLKEKYIDESIKFEKETIVIFNRYNNEWHQKPINYLNLETLERLFSILEKDYQIVYLNLNHDKRYFDHLEPLQFNDTEVLQKFPSVLTFQKLKELFPNLTINELQVRIFANCEKYISQNGGQLILSAYFGGENIIFSKKCRELEQKKGCSFFKWYHKFGNAIFHHVNNYDSLIDLVRQKWIDKKPLINILIRTSKKSSFETCINSIQKQTYKNINIIVSTDTEDTKNYVLKEKCRQIECNYSNNKELNDIKNHELYFEPNLYLNNLHNEIIKGHILYFDDDNIFENENSLKTIVDKIQSENEIIFWKFQFNNQVIPNDEFFEKTPEIGQINMNFLFHHKYKQKWEPFKNENYNIAKKLYQLIPNKIWINQILTKSLQE